MTQKADGPAPLPPRDEAGINHLRPHLVGLPAVLSKGLEERFLFPADNDPYAVAVSNSNNDWSLGIDVTLSADGQPIVAGIDERIVSIGDNIPKPGTTFAGSY